MIEKKIIIKNPQKIIIYLAWMYLNISKKYVKHFENNN